MKVTMKMVMAVVQAADAVTIMDALTTAGYRVTRIATTGGWLRSENTTLLLGVEDRQVNHALRVLQQTGRHRTSYISMPTDISSPHQEAPLMEVEVGGATVFVLDVERFEHF
jgi:uncharacterized protein YaaQ